MKKIVLIGGGGHCKSVVDTLLKTNEYDEIVVTDAVISKGSDIFGCKVAGTDDELSELRKKGFDFAIITVGSIHDTLLRKRLREKAFSLGFVFPVICDPNATISPFATIGEGTFVGKNASVNADVQIGEHCIINTGSIVEHECVVGSFTHISIGSILCGNVHIKEDCFIGAGSTVIQGLSIGNNVIVGANSTVLCDVEDNMTVYGIVTKQGGYNLIIITPYLIDYTGYRRTA